ncbi:hypothetical protein L1887_48061 [Cichorium endivia]|nr:hypothetical protein L1887_48061 [Cichorium endivia]
MSWTFACVLLRGSVAFTFWLERLEAGRVGGILEDAGRRSGGAWLVRLEQRQSGGWVGGHAWIEQTRLVGCVGAGAGGSDGVRLGVLEMVARVIRCGLLLLTRLHFSSDPCSLSTELPLHPTFRNVRHHGGPQGTRQNRKAAQVSRAKNVARGAIGCRQRRGQERAATRLQLPLSVRTSKIRGERQLDLRESSLARGGGRGKAEPARLDTPRRRKKSLRETLLTTTRRLITSLLLLYCNQAVHKEQLVEGWQQLTASGLAHDSPNRCVPSMSYSDSAAARRDPPSSGKKHYRAKSISRSSVDLDNSETGALLLAPNGLASEADDHLGYPPHSASAGPAGAPSRSCSPRRMPLGSRRLALILFGFVGLLVLFGRRDSRDAVVGYAKDKAGQVGSAYQHAPWKAQPTQDSNNAVGFPVAPTPASTPAAAPVSGTKADTVRQKPALHPDPSKTTRCDGTGPRPVDHNGRPRPLVQYALMIDAGSTGSRIHVYRFNYCSESPELEGRLPPILCGRCSSRRSSAFPPTCANAPPWRSRPPQACVSLPGKQAEDVLKAVRHMLEFEYPFPIADGRNADGTKASKGVEIMDGKDEGVFAWITVNYLLNRIGSSSADKLETAAGHGPWRWLDTDRV